MPLILVTGAARSGKSEWAECLAAQSGLAVVYVATAQVDDTDLEWRARIERHQRRRPPAWTTRHVPIALAATVEQAPATQCLLIDSLGTWLANRLEADELTWETTEQHLLAVLAQASSQVIVVAEETGWGVVPAYPLGRTFRDRLGRLTRAIAAIADPAYLVVAGYALNLKQLGVPIRT
ncbi:MAG: bifunctional adenosylcobinamide kinase/adenosylcobinamide-phosphate guanylyltransferase [Leptolyngbyaceae cyanobacterium bins.349]|nr:bifunctional adenosylcobinamide kinase/adenosylcobinamide-phosphate guanylyltransferase [Leptolyngbyaceae cyanobacterium bins.349]